MFSGLAELLQSSNGVAGDETMKHLPASQHRFKRIFLKNVFLYLNFLDKLLIRTFFWGCYIEKFCEVKNIKFNVLSWCLTPRSAPKPKLHFARPQHPR